MRSSYLILIVLSVITGLALALITYHLGALSFPIVFFLIVIFPWLLHDNLRLFIWLIVTWPLLTLIVRYPLPAGIPDLSYERVLVLLLVCIILLEALLSNKRLMKITALDILIIGYLAAQMSSRFFVLWFGGIGKPDLNGLLDVILIPLALYWMIKNLIASEADLKWFLGALVIASLLVCLTGLYEQVVGMRVFKTSISLGGSEVTYLWQDPQGRLRAAGALANPAIYGATLGTGILAGICLLPQIKRKLTQAALVLTIGVLLYGVFASYTRSAWLSVFIALFAAQFFVNDLWKRTLPILMLGSVFVVLIIWNILPNSSDIVQRALTVNTITQRAELNHVGWEKFLERPYLGWGSGALNIFGDRQVGITSHNTYLTFLVDGGLLLFFSFAAVVGYLLVRIILVYKMTEKSSWERNVLVVMTGSVLIYLLSGLALTGTTIFWLLQCIVLDLHGNH
jgi:O-antigen ligase